MPISRYSLPEEHREGLFTIYLSAGVSEYATLLTQGQNEFQNPWPPEALVLFGRQLYEGMTCIEAYRILTAADIAGVLDTVRNKVLSFAIEIEKDAPDVGETAGAANLPAGRVQQVFQTTVMGNASFAVAAGDMVTQQVSELYNGASLDQVMDALKVLGLPESDRAAFRAATEGPPETVKGRIGEWVGTTGLKLTGGGLKLAGNVGVEVLTNLAKGYLQRRGINV